MLFGQCLIRSYPYKRLGGERLRESEVSCPNTKLWLWAEPGLEPRPALDPGSSALAILGGHRAFHSLFLLQALKAAASIICVVCGLISCTIWRILYFILYFYYFYFSHLRSSFFQFCRNNASVPYALSQTKKRLIRITNNNTFKKSANIV